MVLFYPSYPPEKKTFSFNNIFVTIMDEELTASLILKFRKSKSCSLEKMTSFQSPRRQSVRIKQEDERQVLEFQSSQSVASSALQWQKSDEAQVLPSPSPQRMKPSKKKIMKHSDWFGTQQKTHERTLNDQFFNLTPKVQKILYIINYILNAIIRIMFIYLLVFLAIENKWIYLQIFLSLEATAVIMYFIVMVKMLFTRSDKESVYFQKIFNEAEWADIQSQRLMRTHFNLSKIVSKICVFFNPCTKFEKNTKISFLRQEIFKRMELIMVYTPFSILFFLEPGNFISEGKPNFNVYITAGIVLQSLRTTFTYLIVYTYN